MIDADAVFQVVDAANVGIRSPRRSRAEPRVVARTDLVVLGDVVAVGGQHSRRAGRRARQVVAVAPVPGVALEAGGVVARGEVGRIVEIVFVQAELQRCPRIARQVVDGGEARRDVEPVRQIRNLRELAESGEPARLDRTRVDLRIEVLEADAWIDASAAESSRSPARRRRGPRSGGSGDASACCRR